MTYKKLQQQLQTKTFEQIVADYNKAHHTSYLIECDGNYAYEDDELIAFLTEIGCKNLIHGLHFLQVEADNETYRIHCEERPNRFNDDLPPETILMF